MRTILDEILTEAELDSEFERDDGSEMFGASTRPLHEPGVFGGLEDEQAMTATPVPGRYYRISKGDSLLKIAGRAYNIRSGTQERLALARKINRHPLNENYLRRQDANALFPEGQISFYPHFTCDPKQLMGASSAPAKGSCFAVLWIPVREDFYHRRLGKAVDVPQSFVRDILRKSRKGKFTPASIPPAAIEASSVGETNRLSLVPDVTQAPFRFICSIISVIPHPSNPSTVLLVGPASGTLIGLRHVLTAAHVLHSDLGDGLLLRASTVVVTPGDDSLNKYKGPPGELPFGLLSAYLLGTSPVGSFISKTFTVPDAWESPGTAPHHLFDYGLIRLNTSVGNLKWGTKRFGYWGSSKWGEGTRIIPRKTRSDLQNQIVYLSGYPTQRLPRHGISQWLGGGLVDNASLPAYATGTRAGRARLGYTIPAEDGHSGSPVWRVVRSNGQSARTLVAVHSDGGFGIEASNGVLLTSSVLDDLKRMKTTR